MTRLMTALCCAVLLHAISQAAFSNDAKAKKPLRIKWEAIDGVSRYQVEIANESGTILLAKTVETNYIEFRLPPGRYRIRIGAINKFEKLSFWSDWDDFEIRKSQPSKFFSNDFPAVVGVTIRGGVSYHMLLPTWNRVYRHSSFNVKYLGFYGSVGFHFGDSKKLKVESFLKYTGIELEASICRYRDRFDPYFQTSLMTVNGGPALFLKTRFSIPLNFYLRAGGGLSYVEQRYRRLNIHGIPLQQGSIRSYHPYARVGLAAEFNFLYALNLSVGADYFILFIPNNFFSYMRYIAMVGVRI